MLIIETKKETNFYLYHEMKWSNAKINSNYEYD